MGIQNQKEYLLADESYRIIGAAMEVHNELGHGFLEPVYQEALAIEFLSREIPFLREYPLSIRYKHRKLAKKYVADFICFDSIIVELKAIGDLAGSHTAQVLNYLKATNLKIGLLVNFGTPKLQYRRLIL